MANRFYEVLIAFDPPTVAAEADALAAKLSQFVTDAKGSVKGVEKLGLRRLAFRVQGRSEAQFLLLTCEMPAPVVKQIENVLSLQSLPSTAKPSAPGLRANAHGFSLHAAVRWRADQRAELDWSSSAATSPDTPWTRCQAVPITLP